MTGSTKQSISPLVEAWIGSSQPLVAMTETSDSNFKQRGGVPSCSRGAMRPRFASTSPSFANRGRRESRVPTAPAVVRTKSARVDHRFNRIIPAFPAQMVYGLLRALLGDRACLPPSPSGLMIRLEPGWAGCISARLDASIGAPGPHDFAVRARPRQRSCRASCRPASSGKDGWQRRSSARRPIAHGKTRPAIPCAPDAVASIASHRAFVTSRDPPLIRVGRGELVMVICPTC